MTRLLSINSYHYRRGGADCVYFDHAALLEDSLGWDSAFFSMHHPANQASPWSKYFVDEIQIGHRYTLGEKINKASKVVYSFEARRKLKALLHDFHPDVAHIHNIYHHLSPSILPVLKQAGIPSIMTAHDLKIACPNNKMLTSGGVCERCKVGRYYQAVVNRCVQNSLPASIIVAAESYVHRWLDSYRRNLARIVVPSRFFIEKFVEWGWPRELFAHVPNFVEASKFEPNYAPGNYFLYFGRLSSEKGCETLIRAAADAGVVLRVAGTGPAEMQLKRLATGLGARTEFLGYRAGTDLHTLIRNSRATILPSEWYENAPLSVLESFAFGKPVVGSRIGGIPELVRPNETGWLFESGNADQLAECLRRIDVLSSRDVSELGRQARRCAEQEFSRNRYISAIVNVYREAGVAIAEIADFARTSHPQREP